MPPILSFLKIHKVTKLVRVQLCCKDHCSMGTVCTPPSWALPPPHTPCLVLTGQGEKKGGHSPPNSQVVTQQD